ncbi:L-serine ammonia-lyase [Azospirillum canadense]|uniref:L-serine ammonia-lyase n=1 Tax=Azospirillum canadense TaxID=403962 RepID=UPI002225DCC5|nr:L-serine ammonia-lyase [Azospirillum canadense]MCW2239384.1 L-serine dehydratase [Azospirillum canadense]
MISALDLFKIGIGPSSSHTVGPMKAALRFLEALAAGKRLGDVRRVLVELYGSLALTGRGHGSDTAVLLGLAGQRPETVDPDAVAPLLLRIRADGRLALGGVRDVAFDEGRDLCFNMGEVLPVHSNGMRFHAFDGDGRELAVHDYYSIGGGFIVTGEESGEEGPTVSVPFPFANAADLVALAQAHGLSIAELVRANEEAMHGPGAVDEHLRRVIATMRACIDRGCRTDGELPGPFKVRRRAPSLRRKLENGRGSNAVAPHEAFDWVSLFAIAVNEENAAGGKVVTAPTNGAAGIVPAVMEYHRRFYGEEDEATAFTFLLTAAAVGILAKMNASISGAEVGCQGEVGVAASMAAAGLAAVLGGTPAQVENAAEIALEHHLGMTCDPVGGLVQIPCIERNAMGAVKAISAASLALKGDGHHYVSLDCAIRTMRETGRDMQTKYKETSLGGLAVNVVEC